jgi:hypothetical protein
LEGDWIPDFYNELEEFPMGAHDDQIDAVSLAAAWLTGRRAARRRQKVPASKLQLGKTRISSKPIARLR